MNLCHPRRFLRNLLFAPLLCAIAFSGPATTRLAYAQSEKDISLAARPGFDGYCKEGNWLPVRIEIENTGPDLNATVRVAYQNDRAGQTATTMDILLPTKSRKEFFLYIYPQSRGRSMIVDLLVKGRSLKKANLAVSCLASTNLLFGVIADNPSTFDILNDVKSLSGFTRVAQLTISDLPASSHAWDSLDALIVSNVDTGRLTPEQKQALKLWLGAGGKLLVFGGPNWQGASAGLQDFLPIDIDATTRASALPELQAYVRDTARLETEAVLTTGKLHQEAEILVEQNGVPVLVRAQIGAGAVYYFAADPALQPLSAWNGMRDLYDHVLGFKASPPAWADQQLTNYYDVNQALATIPELGLPSIFYICGLLVLYIIVIGPLNYFVLRRMKRRELAWVTIPALVVIFTGLSYSTGLLYRGTTPILNRLAVAQAWDGVDQASVRALVGIYSPVRAKYDLEATGNFTIRPAAASDTNLQANNDSSAILQGSTMVMPDIRIEIGGMKAVTLEGNLPALEISHDLVITVDRVNPMLSGTIWNKSAYALQDAILVTSGQWTRLGDLAPGQSRQINLSLMQGASGPDFYRLSVMDVIGANYPDIQTDEELARRYGLVQTVLTQQYGVNRGNWGVYLMGWIEEAALPVGLQDQGFKTIDTMLYIDSLSPSSKIGRDEVTLPASLFAWESSNPNASPYYVSGIPTGGYILRFRPAIPIHFREMKSLQLFLRSNASPGDLIASAWDYEEKEWRQVPIAGGSTSLPEPNRFVGPDNEIRIKVISNRSDWTEITASYVQLVVQP